MYKRVDESLEHIAKMVVDSCFAVHKELGPGLIESVYEICLIEELKNRNLKVSSQVELPIIYKGKHTGKFLKLDIIVEDSIIIELKAVNKMLPVFDAQILSYLKLMNKRLGFLVNFNVPVIKQGIKRFII